MNYYFSGFPPLYDADYVERAWNTPCRLLSCHGAYVRPSHQWMSEVIKNPNAKAKNTILLDSGAFTAWSQGKEVTIEHLLPVYYDFMMKYWSYCKEIYLINLDKIPGSPGRTAGTEEINEATRMSDANYRILTEYFGTDRVLPVFHQNESESRLFEVEAMGPYICVSPRNDLPEGQRVSWSREVHSKLPAGKHTHGLAATGEQMMSTVPWHSVDSASIVFTVATGQVTIILNRKLINVAVSSKNTNRFDAGQHYCNMPVQYREIIDKRFEELGTSAIELSEDYRKRAVISMRQVQEFVDNHLHVQPIKQVGLFEI